MKTCYVLIAISIAFTIAAQIVSINYGLKQSVMLWVIAIMIMIPALVLITENATGRK